MKVKIKVEGMHCKSCDMLIEDALMDLDGVETIESSFETGIVKISFDESKVKMDAIKKVIKAEGYEVE